jgi:hypothetical protein
MSYCCLFLIIVLTNHCQVHAESESILPVSVSTPNVDFDVPDDNKYDLRWVSATGGWRALSANMGMTHVFAQLGLISANHCTFTAISGASGASWFATQLMFSKPFFDNLATNNTNPTSVQTFVKQWMTSLVKYHESIQKRRISRCNLFDKLKPQHDIIKRMAAGCRDLTYVRGDWAEHIQKVFKETTTDYGDPLFVQSRLSHNNLLTPFKNTELYVHFALSTTSRIRPTILPINKIVYIPPNQPSDSTPNIYTVPIGFVLVINDNSTEPHYDILTEAESLPIQTRSTQYTIMKPFEVEQYASWFLRLIHPNNTIAYSNLAKIEKVAADKMSLLRSPFGGVAPTTAQINGATSGVFSSISGSTPSLLAQSLTSFESIYGINFGNFIPNLIYNLPQFRDTSVCSQWPSKCGTSDGRLIDGFFTERSGLAINIGQYQTSNQYSKKKILKIIYIDALNGSIDEYFKNGQTEPGQYYWPKGNFLPQRSTVIFKKTPNISQYQQLKDVKIKVRIVKTTTIDNPIFNVHAGLRVELLEILVLEEGDWLLFNLFDKYKIVTQLSKMAYLIANSKELKTTITKFLV